MTTTDSLVGLRLRLRLRPGRDRAWRGAKRQIAERHEGGSGLATAGIVIGGSFPAFYRPDRGREPRGLTAGLFARGSRVTLLVSCGDLIMMYHHGVPPDDWIAALNGTLELTVLLNDDMNESLALQGLTRARTHLLWVLHLQGPSTQRAVAQALGVSARNVTGLVDALVATGFVVRGPHPTDRRATLVSFTDHGAVVVAKMADDHQNLARVLFGGMPPRDLACFTKGLGLVTDRLRARLAKAVDGA